VFYCEHFFDSKEKLYEHLIVHSNLKMGSKNKSSPKNLAKQRHEKCNKQILISHETNIKTKSKSSETRRLFCEIADLSDQILQDLNKIQRNLKKIPDLESL